MLTPATFDDRPALHPHHTSAATAVTTINTAPSRPRPMRHSSTVLGAHNPTSLSAVDTEHKRRNKVQEAADAERLFRDKHYDECAAKSREVLDAEPSEAIRAKCHMYLAMPAVNLEPAAIRAYHAAMAVHMWTSVIERTGSSRFPIERAKVQLAISGRLLDEAEAAADEETARTAETETTASA